MKDDIIGTAEAARMLGMTQDYVKRLAQRKRIPATMLGKMWTFRRADVAKYTPAPVGRPRTRKRKRK